LHQILCGSQTFFVLNNTGYRQFQSAENSKKLADRQRLWLIEAVKCNVVPLDDRRASSNTATTSWASSTT
jgi:hypothetical protein